MWSAVPDIDGLSSGSSSDEEKSVNSEDEGSRDNRTNALNVSCSNSDTAPPRGVPNQHWQVAKQDASPGYHIWNLAQFFCTKSFPKS